MDNLEPMSGVLSDLPNLTVFVDSAPRGTIEARDWERWNVDMEYTNWWWMTLQRDDGVWVEDSTRVELAAPSLEQLIEMTRQAIDLLLGMKHPTIRFEAARDVTAGEDPPDVEDGETSALFRQVDELVSKALLAAGGREGGG